MPPKIHVATPRLPHKIAKKSARRQYRHADFSFSYTNFRILTNSAYPNNSARETEPGWVSSRASAMMALASSKVIIGVTSDKFL